MRPSGLRLFAMLAIWLMPLFLLRMAWHFVTDDQARIVDATLRFGPDDLAFLLLTAAWWTWAVTAAIAAAGDRPAPMRQATKALPVTLTAMLGSVLLLVAGFFLAGLALPGGGGAVILVAVASLIVIVPIIARFALVGAAALFNDNPGLGTFGLAATLVRRRVVATGMIVAFGVIAPALAVGSLIEVTRPTTFWPGIVHWLAFDIALILLAQVQAYSLLSAFVRATGLQLSRWTGPSLRQVAGAVGLVALSTLLAGGSMALQRLPEVSRVSHPELFGVTIQIGWPAGRHPIIIGQSAIDDCLDDVCSAVKTTPLGITMYQPSGSAVIAPDGAVFALGQDYVTHCDAQRRCQNAKDRLPAVIKSEANALALSASGELLIATATPIGDSVSEATEVELGLVRCADVLCAQSHTTKLGVVPASMRRVGSWRQQMVAIGLDNAGRPIVGFRHPHLGSADHIPLWVARCDTAECASARVGELSTNDADELASLQFDGQLGCLQNPCGTNDPVTTIARPRGGVYAMVFEPRTRNLWLQVGEPTDEMQADLLICTDASCKQSRRLPIAYDRLGGSTWQRPYPVELWMIAANPDGRVLLTRPQYIPHEVFIVRP